MRIVILGDTHIPKRGKELPERLIKELSGADHIIHTGDWITMEVYDKLKCFAPVDGVYGNADDESVRERFRDKEILIFNNLKIGLVHGHGEKKTTERRAMEAFDENLDCVLFDHSHIPYLRYHNKTLLFNPGSVTDKRKLPFYSFGIMTIDKDISVSHVFFT
ncbi:metallophosphoesterase [Bacillus sp. H-16]|uniref:metallophosphoesterase family protein n=1 Tax=Alteribacter salitolerans TaxID=2912333 RepID=UPI001964A666|nr:metallophosphoesterase [Alteribacter salitolerans]MBM7094425.1 metallophosphoesterase [Alteribacter salitolerans]